MICGAFPDNFQSKKLLGNTSPNLFSLIYLKTCIEVFRYAVIVDTCKGYSFYIWTSPASYTAVWVWLSFLTTQYQPSLWSAYHLIRLCKKELHNNFVSSIWSWTIQCIFAYTPSGELHHFFFLTCLCHNMDYLKMNVFRSKLVARRVRSWLSCLVRPSLKKSCQVFAQDFGALIPCKILVYHFSWIFLHAWP